MAFGGSSEPCALCSLHSIGKIGGAQNRSYSKLLCGLLAERLRVSPDRCVAPGDAEGRGGGEAQPAEPGIHAPQDLHQLLRHERGQRGLERLHLRLRATPARPACARPCRPQYCARFAPSDPHLQVGTNKRFGGCICLGLPWLSEEWVQGRDSDLRTVVAPSESTVRILSPSFFPLCPIRGPSLDWPPARGHRPSNQTQIRASHSTRGFAVPRRQVPDSTLGWNPELNPFPPTAAGPPRALGLGGEEWEGGVGIKI